MEQKWTFLNIRRKDYDNLDYDDKKEAAKDFFKIEYLAKEFESENIISTGTDDFRKNKDKIINIIREDNSIKAKNVNKKKISKGLAVIRQQIGHKKES